MMQTCAMSPEERLPVDEFRSVLAALRKAPAPLIRGSLKQAVMRKNAACWLCDCVADRAEWVVSERAGGHAVVENLAPVCERCARDRATRDVLEWAQENRKPLTEEQRRRRNDALAVSDQHAVPKKFARTVQACRKHLEATRWQHARAPLVASVGASGALMGSPELASVTAAAMLFSFRRAGCEDLGGGLIRLPADMFQTRLGELVEQHAIVRSLRIEGFETHEPWVKTYAGVGALKAVSSV